MAPSGVQSDLTTTVWIASTLFIAGSVVFHVTANRPAVRAATDTTEALPEAIVVWSVASRPAASIGRHATPVVVEVTGSVKFHTATVVSWADAIAASTRSLVGLVFTTNALVLAAAWVVTGLPARSNRRRSE